MELSNYNIQSAAFQPESVHQYELSILTGMDSFSYIIRDRAQNRLLAYCAYRLSPEQQANYESTTAELLQQDRLLSELNYGSVVLGWETERLTLVPRDLYDADHQRDYLEHLTLIGLDDTVREEWHNDLDAHLLYAVNSAQIENASRHLSAARMRHPAGGLLTTWGLRSRRLAESSVSIALRGTRLFVGVHRSGSLQFFNTFQINTKEDALYYTLLAYEQCGMVPNRVPLYLCGEIVPDGTIFQILYTYVEEVRFCRYGAPPALPPELVDLPPHLYFDLLCLG